MGTRRTVGPAIYCVAYEASTRTTRHVASGPPATPSTGSPTAPKRPAWPRSTAAGGAPLGSRPAARQLIGGGRSVRRLRASGAPRRIESGLWTERDVPVVSEGLTVLAVLWERQRRRRVVEHQVVAARRR